MMPAIGKMLIILGIILIMVGIGFLIKKERFSFYFPITTSIIISIILTILFSLFRK
jgi:hypothetical protein